MRLARIVLFAALLIVCATGFVSPPVALALGLALALTLGHPFPQHNAKATKILLQLSVIGLGFGMNLQTVVAAGKRGIAWTAATIAITLVLGWAGGRALRVSRTTSHLIASGTAICGGSAIAAVGPVIGASDEEMSVSLGTVFILNSIALFLFPPIGHRLGLTQPQFGVWAAIAIHDTSSVVGAAAKYGAEALKIATVVKLTRALWIVPLTIGTALAFRRSRAGVTPAGEAPSRRRAGRRDAANPAGGDAGATRAIPWFIGGFVLASVARTYTPQFDAAWTTLVTVARIGLTVTLFLIGAGLSRKNLKSVGARPLILGVLLWIVISAGALFVVMRAA